MPNEPERIAPILQYSVLCDAIGQAQNSKLVFVGVFCLLMRPSTMPQMFIANAWTYGKGKFRENVRILNPELAVMVEVPAIEFELKDQALAHINISGVGGLSFDRVGTYWVEISLDGNRILAYPLPVLQPS